MTTTVDTTDQSLHEANSIIQIINSLPTLSREEIKERYLDRNPQAKRSLWADDRGTGGLHHKYKPAPLDLPGFGERYDGSDGHVPCGAKIPHVGSSCGSTHEVGRTCARSRCPRCAPAWAIKRAIKATQNIHSAAKMKEGRQFKHHAVISPPPETYVDTELTEDDEPEQAMISTIQDIMREIDMEGIVLYHPWAGESAPGIEEAHDDDDRGEWKKRLFNNRDWKGDVREELEHRPHFHVVGTCPWFPGGDTTKEIYDRTGWVMHRITERNGSAVSLGDMNAVARASSYAISHCAIDTRGEQNRYVFGKVGSAYHNNDGRHSKEAKEAVHRVAPDTLGIPRMDIECGQKVPEEEAEHDIDKLAESSDGDEVEQTSDDDPGMARCGCDLDPIHQADYVHDDDWQQQALHADEAVEAREQWDELGGWQGWMAEQTGQSTLPTDPPD